MNTRRTLRIATFATSALAVVALAAGAASALSPATATVRVSNGTADFGSGLHANGAPTGSGVIKERFDESGVVVNTIRGTLYVDRPTAGCAGVKFTWKDGGQVVRTSRFTKCGPGGDPDLPANQAAITDGVVTSIASNGADSLTVTTGVPFGLGFNPLSTRSVTVAL